MRTGRQHVGSRRLATAGVVGLAFAALIVLIAQASPAFWSRAGSYVALGIAIVASSLILFTGLSTSPSNSRAHGLSAGAAGLLMGVLVGPSTGAIVGVAISALVLSEAVRGRAVLSLASYVICLVFGAIVEVLLSG